VLNLLVVSTWWPYPPDNGSRVRVFNLLRELSKRYRITLVAFGEPGVPEDAEPLRECCDRVEAIPPTTIAGRRLGVRGLLSPVPRHYVQTESAAMHAQLAPLIASHDAALGLQIDAARYLVGYPDLPRVFEEVEVTMLRESTPPHVNYTTAPWDDVVEVPPLHPERGGAFDGATVVSAEEREQLRQIGCDADRIAIVPNGVEACVGEPPGVRADRIIYPGSVMYEANRDAVRYFVRDIFPLIRRVRPDVSFWVTGATGDVDISELTVPGVTFTGRLADVRPTVAESAACVVPLRVGGGTRLKVLEAMAIGTPVVTTPKGIEGLAVEPGRHVAVGTSPEAFAAQVLRVMEDVPLRARMIDDARRLVSDRYAWGPIGDTLDRVIRDAIRHHETKPRSGRASVKDGR
jgi:glycosyltransferase involved in cell wall biosynthesis